MMPVIKRVIVRKDNLKSNDIEQLAKHVLRKNDSLCLKQENCPIDVIQLYSHVINTLPYQDNESLLMELQKRIRALEISTEDRQKLFSDMVLKASEHFSNQSRLESPGGHPMVNMRSVLMFSTLTSYLLQKPEPRNAIDVISRSLSRSTDTFVNKFAQTLLLKTYPEHYSEIQFYLANSGIAGLGG
jgi:hypothetical protein